VNHVLWSLTHISLIPVPSAPYITLNTFMAFRSMDFVTASSNYLFTKSIFKKKALGADRASVKLQI
jgi:hypothetical protein